MYKAAILLIGMTATYAALRGTQYGQHEDHLADAPDGQCPPNRCCVVWYTQAAHCDPVPIWDITDAPAQVGAPFGKASNLCGRVMKDFDGRKSIDVEDNNLSVLPGGAKNVGQYWAPECASTPSASEVASSE